MPTRIREVPWLGCGTSGAWTDVEQALHDSGQLYEVEQVNAYDNLGKQIPGVLVNRRTDNYEIVGATSDRYGVIQNHEGFAMLEPFIQAGGVIEHAGITEQEMVFMVMKMPAAAFGFKFAGDGFDVYVCAMNSFNTRFPLAIIITPIRVYCQNMFRKLMQNGDTVLSIKHGRLAGHRMMAATKVAGLLTCYTDEFVRRLDSAATTKRSRHDVDEWLEQMFPLVPVDAEHPRAETSNKRIEYVREKFLDEYYDAPDNQKYKGTRLGLLNAYFDWVSHSDPSKSSPGSYAQRRFSNLMLGTAVRSKLIAQA